MSNASQPRLLRARAFIDRHYDQPIDLAQIGAQAGFSRYHFLRLFRTAFRETPHQYLMRRRIERARALLAASDLSITEICFAVGFQSLGSFSTLFHRSAGCSPRAYRARHAGQHAHALARIPACFLTMYGVEASAD